MSLLRFFSIVSALFVFAEAGVRTDTLAAKSNVLVVKDTTKFLKPISTPHITGDSGTIGVLKGQKTIRDSTIFTGGIKGVKLSMDSIFNLTGTAGYVQYLSNTKKFIDGPIFTDGAKAVAIGKSSVENWNSSYRVLQIGGVATIMALASEAVANTFYSTNMYNDAVWKPFVNGVATMYKQSLDGCHLWYSNTGLTADVSFIPDTLMKLDTNEILTVAFINTGNGNNELYAMNQNVRDTDDVKFDSNTTTVTNTTRLRIGNGDALTVYDTGSFACSTYVDDLTVQAKGTIKYVNIGNKITLSITGPLNGTSNSSGYSINIGAMPTSIMPDSVTSGPTGPVTDNGDMYSAYYFIVPADKRIYINHFNTATFVTSGNKGINTLSKRTELEYVKH